MKSLEMLSSKDSLETEDLVEITADATIPLALRLLAEICLRIQFIEERLDSKEG